MEGKEPLLQSSSSSLDVSVEVFDELKSNYQSFDSANSADAQKLGLSSSSIDDDCDSASKPNDVSISIGAANTSNTNDSEIRVTLSAETITKLAVLVETINDCRTDLYFACSKKKSPLPILSILLYDFCELKEEVERSLHKLTATTTTETITAAVIDTNSNGSSAAYPIISIDPVNCNNQSTNLSSPSNDANNTDAHLQLRRLQLAMDEWQITCDNYKSEYFRQTTTATAPANMEKYQMLTAVEVIQTEIDTTFSTLKELLASVPTPAPSKDFATILAAEKEMERKNATCLCIIMMMVMVAIASMLTIGTFH